MENPIFRLSYKDGREIYNIEGWSYRAAGLIRHLGNPLVLVPDMIILYEIYVGVTMHMFDVMYTSQCAFACIQLHILTLLPLPLSES